MNKKDKRITFCASQKEYEQWEDIMFKEKCRSFSSFIRKCIEYYIKENYNDKILRE